LFVRLFLCPALRSQLFSVAAMVQNLLEQMDELALQTRGDLTMLLQGSQQQQQQQQQQSSS
jgi:hypothetical protein